MRAATLGDAMTKQLAVFIAQVGKHYRVKYQRHYPNNVVEEVLLPQRFSSLADAQHFADTSLKAQRIYRGLADGKSPGNGMLHPLRTTEP
jgi:hypothetical protein